MSQQDKIQALELLVEEQSAQLADMLQANVAQQAYIDQLLEWQSKIMSTYADLIAITERFVQRAGI